MCSRCCCKEVIPILDVKITKTRHRFTELQLFIPLIKNFSCRLSILLWVAGVDICCGALTSHLLNLRQGWKLTSSKTLGFMKHMLRSETKRNNKVPNNFLTTPLTLAGLTSCSSLKPCTNEKSFLGKFYLLVSSSAETGRGVGDVIKILKDGPTPCVMLSTWLLCEKIC